MEGLILTIAAIAGAIATGVGNAVAHHKMNKRMKKRKKQIEAIKAEGGIPANEPFNEETTPIANENGERVDPNDYLELEIIEKRDDIDIKKCYNKKSGKIEILYAFPETSRPANVPQLKFKS